MRRRPPGSTLFPYTTLFRSSRAKNFREGPLDKFLLLGRHGARFVMSLHLGERRLCQAVLDRKSTRLNSSHGYISYAAFCLKKKIVDHPALHPESHVL